MDAIGLVVTQAVLICHRGCTHYSGFQTSVWRLSLVQDNDCTR
jgi:hypothetical protein